MILGCCFAAFSLRQYTGLWYTIFVEKKYIFSDLNKEDQKSCCRSILNDIRLMFDDPAVEKDYKTWLNQYKLRKLKES